VESSKSYPSDVGNLKGYPLERQHPQWDSWALPKTYTRFSDIREE